jgi:hypothetical protein
MRENTDRSRQTEKSARQRSGKAKLGENDGCCPIDVHGNIPPLSSFNSLLDFACNNGEVAIHNTFFRSPVDKFQNSRGTPLAGE